ncbi:hypothetical protein V3C99_007711 [Haemonchus contortus]
MGWTVPLVAIQSHLLAMLLTKYVEICFFIVISGRGNLSMFSGDQNSTTSEVLSSFEGLKAGLHVVAVLCVLAAVIIHNVEILTTLPPSVIIVVLVFTLIFNIVGTVLLFVYSPPPTQKGSTAILACAVLSSLAILFTIGTGGAFIAVPFNKGGEAGGRTTQGTTGGGTDPPPFRRGPSRNKTTMIN